jgi:hypothetical protein
MRRIILLVALLSAFHPSIADACQMMTIPELIERRRPEPVERYMTAELVSVPFDEVLAEAEVIVEGRVRLIKTYMGEDKCYLYTDFEVVAPLAIVGSLPRRKTPGPQPPVVVRQLGGTLVIDGVKVIVEDMLFPPFIEEQHVLLLLSRLAGGRYGIAGGAFGAFVIEADGKVRPVLRQKGIYDDMQSLAKADFLNRVKRAK